jgi:hypothetical protein
VDRISGEIPFRSDAIQRVRHFMIRSAASHCVIAAFIACSACAEDLFERIDDALTFSLVDDSVRLRISGTVELEYYHIDEPPFGLVNSTANNLFNPRLTLFADTQIGPYVYAFAQARVDRGFDPSDAGIRARMDEYALRLTPWEDGRFSVQVGKFAPVVGNWMSRHLAWDNPFVSAPLPYEHVTPVSDVQPPLFPAQFVYGYQQDASYEYLPIIWSAAYATGISVSGRLGEFEYAAEIKNAALSSRPDSWDAMEIGFDHPTFSTRLGWRPTMAWNVGLSASRGAYLRPEAEPFLPRGHDIGDYEQFVLGQDISFATGHLQIWVEFYEARFEVPRVGEADTFAYYIEAKYKLTPEIFTAVRWNQQFFNEVPDGYGGEAKWGDDLWRADLAVGYRFNANMQLKAQYSIQNEEGPRGRSGTFALQFMVRF